MKRLASLNFCYCALLFAFVVIVFGNATIAWSEEFQNLAFLFEDNNQSYIISNIYMLPSYGVNRIILSGNIISFIDQINTTPSLRDMINAITSAASQNNIEVYVLVNELNYGQSISCLDPLGAGEAIWQQRRTAYTQALSACPSLSGVVLRLDGNALKIWDITGQCSYDQTASKIDKIQLLISNVHTPVAQQTGKKLIVWADADTPDSLSWIGEAIKTSGLDFEVIAPSTPQDWLSVYPNSPIFNLNLCRNVSVAFDATGKLMGGAVFPSAAVDYIADRWRMIGDKGCNGAVIIADNGTVHALSNEGSANLLAARRLKTFSYYEPDTIYKQWISQRYNQPAETYANTEMIEMFRKTSLALTRMYFNNGFPVFNQNGALGDLSFVNNNFALLSPARWDSQYAADEQKLMNSPTEDIYNILSQEKSESLEFVTDALTSLEEVKPYINSVHYNQLKSSLSYLKICALGFKHVTEAYWMMKLYLADQTSQKRSFLEGSLTSIEQVSNQMDSEYGTTVTPINGAQLRKIATDIRALVPPHQGLVLNKMITKINRVLVADITYNSASVAWHTDNPTDSTVIFGKDPHKLTMSTSFDPALVIDHLQDLTFLSPETTYFFKVISHEESGREVVSGIYSFKTSAPPLGRGMLEGIIAGDKSQATCDTEVQVQLYQYKTKSRKTGNYTLENLPAGHYDIMASKEGSSTQIARNVPIVANLTTKLDFNLIYTGGGEDALTNGNFEGSFISGKVASSWTSFVIGGSVNFSAEQFNFYSGHFAQKMDFGANAEAGIYQRVQALAVTTCDVQARIYINSTLGEGAHLEATIGMDPQGGTDPLAASVRWGAPVTLEKTWHLLSLTSFNIGSHVTIFIKGRSITGNSGVIVYIDNASLIYSGASLAPTKITGYVYDEVLTPIQGAVIETTFGGYNAISQSNGSYEITAMQPGAYTLVAKYAGKTDQVVNWVSLVSGQSAPIVYFHLKPLFVATPTSIPCNAGDANCDLQITPGDALRTFEIYLDTYIPTGGELCDVMCAADINNDGRVTPGDALCIFLTYLQQPC